MGASPDTRVITSSVKVKPQKVSPAEHLLQVAVWNVFGELYTTKFPSFCMTSSAFHIPFPPMPASQTTELSFLYKTRLTSFWKTNFSTLLSGPFTDHIGAAPHNISSFPFFCKINLYKPFLDVMELPLSNAPRFLQRSP